MKPIIIARPREGGSLACGRARAVGWVFHTTTHASVRGSITYLDTALASLIGGAWLRTA